MSQQVRILSAKVTGTVYIGQLLQKDGTHKDTWSSNPETIIRWLSDAYRSRKNDRRSLRSKYVYKTVFIAGATANDPIIKESQQVKDSFGNPVLIPISKHGYGKDTTNSEFKKNSDHWSAVPPMVIQHATRQENTEWFAAAKRKKTIGGKMPRFSPKKHRDVKFGIFHNNGGQTQATLVKTGRKTGIVTITGMNPPGKYVKGQAYWQIQFRVRLTQEIRDYTSVLVNWTKKELTFVNQPKGLDFERTGEQTGVDGGVVHTLADSQGNFYDRPNEDKINAEIKKGHRAMARSRRLNKGRRDGKNYQKNKHRMQKNYAKRTHQRNDWDHKTTTHLIRTYNGGVAREDLQLQNMMKSAAGTMEKPGKNVSQKRGLNRGLQDARLGTIFAMLDYKGAASNVPVPAVDCKFSSQECSKCHFISSENRESQAVFVCKQCEYAVNADTNAANITEFRGFGSMSGQGLADQDKAETGKQSPGDIDDKTRRAPAQSAHRAQESGAARPAPGNHAPLGA